MKLNGAIYIETPNRVVFDSNTEIRGVIVGQNNPTGTLLTNSIELRSNVKIFSVSTLPATSDFPTELREMTGSAILIPGFSLLFNSNTGSIGGCIVAS